MLKDTTKNRCVTLAQSYWRNRETQNSIGTLYLKEAEDLFVAWVIHTRTNVLPSKIMFHQRYIKLRNRCQCFCQKWFTKHKTLTVNNSTSIKKEKNKLSKIQSAWFYHTIIQINRTLISVTNLSATTKSHVTYLTLSKYNHLNQ